MAASLAPNIRNTKSNEGDYRGIAMQQMHILREYMRVGKINVLSRTVTLANGVTILCRKCFAREDVWVDIPVNAPLSEEIVSETYGGIILHPRSGVISTMHYVVYVTDDFGGYTGIVKPAKGVIGGWAEGKNILTTAYLFPLVDNDKASFLHGKKITRTGEKEDTNDFNAFIQPGVYGNLYWTNDAVWSPDSKSWDKPFLCLSWRGSPTRHGRLPSNVNIPGLSIIERVVSGLVSDKTDFTAFGTNLYQGGDLLMQTPHYSWPAGGSLDRCLILGAMQNQSGVIFIVTQNDHYGKPDDVGGYFIGIWSNVSSGAGNFRIDGWELLLELPHTRVGLPWFGNSLGTEIVCGNGDAFSIAYVASSPPSIVATYTAYTQPVGTQSQTLPGDIRYEIAFSLAATGLKHFYEFNNDTKMNGVAALSFSATSVQNHGKWNTVVTSLGNPNIVGGNVNAFTDTSVDTYPTFQYCYVTQEATTEEINTLRRLNGYDVVQDYEVGGGGEPCIGGDWLGQTTTPPKGVVKTTRGTGQLTTWNGRLPGSSHAISTDFTVNVCGINIPIVRTTRIWENKRTPHSSVEAEEAGHVKAWIEESCTIEKSTIHYLDERYGVCLFKTTKDIIQLATVQSAEVDRYLAYGVQARSATIVIRPTNYTATTTETWYLVVNGIGSVVATSVLGLFPFGEPMHSTYYNDVVRVFCLPRVPASSAVAPSTELTHAAAGDFGSYEDGYDDPFGAQAQADGGADYFYPAWCRSLQEDPFWKEVALDRFYFTQPGATVLASGVTAYVPPEIVVEPMPIGSFARHPMLGDMYQFLINTFEGNHVVVGSSDINAKINESLSDGLTTHDTTLYYPISLA